MQGLAKQVEDNVVMRFENETAVNAHSIARSFVILLASASVVLAIAVFGAVQVHQSAYASVYPASDAAAEVSQVDQSADNEDEAQDAAAEESIEDEDVPMAAGLGGSEPVAAVGTNLQWLIIAGIVAVLAFFAVSTFRVNRSIDKMRDRLR